MAEYIKREAAIKAMENADCALIADNAESCKADYLREIIKSVPAADVAPVVRCKDCEWFMREHGCPIEASGYHKGGRSLPVENDFCSYGKRKDGGADNG